MSTEQGESEQVIRTFIALEIPLSVRQAMARSQAALKSADSHVSWVPVDNLHLTLAFLGDTLTVHLNPLYRTLDEVAAKVDPFGFSVEGVGAFGPKGAPRIIWAGVREITRPMVQLNEALMQALRSMALLADDRPFKPHITLGRIRSSRGLAALTSLLASVRNSAFGEVHTDRLILMRSHLDEPRVRYSVMHVSPLKGITSNGS